MWDLCVKLLQAIFAPIELEALQIILIGAISKGLLSGIKWICEKLKVELNRTTIQTATLPIACLCLFVYCSIVGFDFDLTTARAWAATLVAALTSIGLHEASKTSFLEDVKKLADMILEKLKKKGTSTP